MALRSHRTLLAAVVAVLIGSTWVAEAQSRARQASRATTMTTDAIARVARLRTSSVVAVHTVTREATRGSNLPWVLPAEEGLGSGVVIDGTGLILTNAHVVDGVDAIHIRTPEGDDIAATVLGADAAVDLALLRATDARGLRPAPLGDSGHLQVGDWVVAIGNPLGLHHTVTAGIVSAKARTLDDSGVEYLQTDAAISPGSSGGPLLDLSGRVIGINVGILSTGRQNVGLNIAIPVNVVKDVLPRLRTGTVESGWIGVASTPLTARGATSRGLAHGLVLTAVLAQGPGRRAGLQSGDIVLGFADDTSHDIDNFYRRIRNTTPGTIVRVRISRNSRELILPVEVAVRPPLDDLRRSYPR